MDATLWLQEPPGCLASWTTAADSHSQSPSPPPPRGHATRILTQPPSSTSRPHNRSFPHRSRVCVRANYAADAEAGFMRPRFRHPSEKPPSRSGRGCPRRRWCSRGRCPRARPRAWGRRPRSSSSPIPGAPSPASLSPPAPWRTPLVRRPRHQGGGGAKNAKYIFAFCIIFFGNFNVFCFAFSHFL